MNKLEIKGLHVSVAGKEILHGINLTLQAGKIHALLGPNGSGKSTLAQALMGNPKFVITSGEIILDGRDITSAKADLRSKLGLFLSFQYPAEIKGLSLHTFLRSIVNNRRENKYSAIEFNLLLKNKMKELSIDSNFSGRDLNAGFSGGEKKRAEILQLALIEPKYAILDETDSGLDVDAIKVVAETIQKIRTKVSMGVLLITHYNKFLEFLKPEQVSVIHQGKIIKQGGAELALEIETQGFAKLMEVENGN